MSHLRKRIRARQAMGNPFWGAVKWGADPVVAKSVNNKNEPKVLVMQGFGDVEGQYVAVADTAPAAPSLTDLLSSDNVRTAATIGLAYHGYRRTGSLLWMLAYAGFGRYVPELAIPVAFAQGIGKRKICTTE